ncbi:MAG: hypothetical protein LW823_04465 [Rickettsiales bacterium]|jgi:hypothetical protein|nr:hypothetical protein [Rickettsiales bacterium]
MAKDWLGWNDSITKKALDALLRKKVGNDNGVNSIDTPLSFEKFEIVYNEMINGLNLSDSELQDIREKFERAVRYANILVERNPRIDLRNSESLKKKFDEIALPKDRITKAYEAVIEKLNPQMAAGNTSQSFSGAYHRQVKVVITKDQEENALKAAQNIFESGLEKFKVTVTEEQRAALQLLLKNLVTTDKEMWRHPGDSGFGETHFDARSLLLEKINEINPSGKKQSNELLLRQITSAITKAFGVEGLGV